MLTNKRLSGIIKPSKRDTLKSQKDIYLREQDYISCSIRLKIQASRR